jgi:hypothetical protein
MVVGLEQPDSAMQIELLAQLLENEFDPGFTPAAKPQRVGRPSNTARARRREL